MRLINDFSLWLINNNKAEITIKNYIQITKAFIKWFENDEGNEFDISDVTTLHIHSYIDYLDKTKRYSPSYINKNIATLKTFFNFAISINAIIYNPMLNIKMKRTSMQSADPKWLYKKELSKFIHTINSEKSEFFGKRDLAICLVMAGAGLRISETSDLLIEDVSLIQSKESITVRNGKGNKFRIIPINKDVIDSIKDWIDYRKKHNIVCRHLFISSKKTGISVRTISYLVSKYDNKSSLDGVSPHKLRHTFCKNLADNGHDLHIIAQLAGHESLDTTRRYINPDINDMRKAVQSISNKK